MYFILKLVDNDELYIISSDDIEIDLNMYFKNLKVISIYNLIF